MSATTTTSKGLPMYYYSSLLSSYMHFHNRVIAYNESEMAKSRKFLDRFHCHGPTCRRRITADVQLFIHLATNKAGVLANPDELFDFSYPLSSY